MSAARKRISPAYQNYLNTKSTVFKGLCIAFTAAILAVLAFVTFYLLQKGFTHISLSFFTELPIPPGMENAPGGMKNALIGTIILIALAGVVGIPLGMLAGIYLSEYSSNSWLGAPTRFISDVLTGVPSIVVGILGYELLVAPISANISYWMQFTWLTRKLLHLFPNGTFNGYAGAAALAFIMIPIVARTTEEMLRLVPHSYREASIALGATKARTILKVVVPAATGSLVTGIMLSIARIAGETAPLLFTALGSRLLTLDPANPFPSLTVQVFTYATGPFKEEQELAWAGMLILIGLVFILNLVVRLTIHSMQRNKLARA
ncbi:MAG: phosphate ABC transporter permease PstA [Phycisphaeraceae bacterium]